ncbi:MAG: ABC transporter permease subunit [Deltaproteobacteria bacterium]|nr:ABC transporter permease subunit [Deltaproteobacteria bacterium]
MRGIIAIFRKEIAIAFSSSIFYTVSFIFLVVSGYFFYSNSGYFNILSLQATRNPFLSERLNLTDMVMRPFFSDIAILLLLMLPLITMRVYAEEKKSGTIELLFTYPISDIAVLTGKYCATMLVLLTMLAGTIPYPVILAVFGSLEWGIVISGYLGIILMGGSFIALGIFTSCLTENQIVAAVISFGTLLLFWVIGWAGVMAGPSWGPILKHISIISHLDPFTQGLIDTRDIVFYLLFIFFWLFLTLRFLNSRFWRD